MTFKLLKHRCVFHITGAALHRLIAHCVSIPLPCPREQDALHSPWLLAGWVPWWLLAGWVPQVPVLGGLLVLGTVWQGWPALGTGWAQELLVRGRLQPGFCCWHVHTGWARAEGLHTQSTLNLVLSLHYSFVWTADSLSLCSGGYFKS